jgi:hypothetical protein
VEYARSEESNHRLEKKFENFMKWAYEEMPRFEIIKEMRMFNNGIASKAYRKYAGPLASIAVAMTIGENHIKKSAITEELKIESATI